ncbi:ATP-dependent helicase [bacterium]|nr:ATP-dependent helicase [bacterium]
MIEFASDDQHLLERISRNSYDSPDLFRLRHAAEELWLVEGFEELMCLPSLHNVDRLPHQERTALHVLRRLRGRAILGDEVGLGKTIEAGLIIKEYLLRGLVKSVLVLCNPSLVPQWDSELQHKFGLQFTTSGPLGNPLRIASLPWARLTAQRQFLSKNGYDLVVVDEAHVLRKRTSSAWKLVQEIPRKFLLLLTATPLQNDLEELYNLITLLRPGQLGTPAEFRRNFVDPKDRRKPLNVASLRELMLDVMVRNTRASVQVTLPPRRARTLRLSPTPAEAGLLEQVQTLIHQAWHSGQMPRKTAQTLQMEAGSSPAALAGTLSKLGYHQLAAQAGQLQLGSKAEATLQLVRRVGEPMLVFSRFRASLDGLQQLLEKHKVPVYLFHGGLSPQQREDQLERFQKKGGVLLLSEVGSEGKNLQFCRHLLNFDLPLNPMRIEQRVGRIHRLGQQRPIEIVNLCMAGSVEDHLLRILDEKLNMFELVVGELEMILGPLEEEKDFEQIVLELAAEAAGPDDLAQLMGELERQILGLSAQAKETQQYDEQLFGEEFAVEEA